MFPFYAQTSHALHYHDNVRADYPGGYLPQMQDTLTHQRALSGVLT